MLLPNPQNAYSLSSILVLFACVRPSECSVLGRRIPGVDLNSTSPASSSKSQSSSTHQSATLGLSSSVTESNHENPLSSTHSPMTSHASSDVTKSSNGLLRSSTPSSTVSSRSSSTAGPLLSPSSAYGSSSITPTTSSTRTTSNGNHATITVAPSTSSYPWGDQVIPLNTCSVTAPEGDIEYEPCVVSAGEIKLSFFPEANGNKTYPSTYWAADWEVMMTSPMIYMMINTITATNNCGPLGPTYSNKVISMAISDVSTLPPYADATAQERIGGQEVKLNLSDLLNCPPRASSAAMSVQTDPHPLSNEYNRCNPHLVYPEQASAIGYPYWLHCGANNYRVGIFDPPGAVPTVDALLATTAAAPYTSSYEAPIAIPIVTAVPVTTTPTVVAPTVKAAPIVVPGSSGVPVDTVIANAPTLSAETPVTEENTISPTANIIPSAPDPSATIIEVTGTKTLGAAPSAPSSPEIALPNGSATSIVAVETPTDTNGNSITASVSVEGIVLAGDSSAPYAHPAAATNLAPVTIPTAIATLSSGQVVPAAAGASTLEVNGQTVTTGGAKSTLAGSNDAATLDPSNGLNIQFASGTASTFTVPPAAPSSTIAATGPTVIATVNGYAVTATPGASTVVIGSQTVSAGGPALTLAGSNNVAILDASSLIIQYPSGTVSAYTLPTAAANVLAPAPAGSTTLNPNDGTPVVVIGSQTVALGGPEITLSNNDVVTLGPLGLEIQMPGGVVSTMTLPVIAGASTSPTPTVQRIANIIASIAGIPPVSGAASVSLVASMAGIGGTISAGTSAAEITAESTSTRVLITGTESPSANVTGTGSPTLSNGTPSANQTLILQTALSRGSRLSIREVGQWSLPALIFGVIYGM